MSQASNVKYATFVQRLTSIFIDTIILVIVQWIVGGVTGYLIGQSMAEDYAYGYVTIEEVTERATAWATIVGIAIAWLYFAMFESSEKQATPGKMAIGLMVTDLDGGRVGFWQATWRHFAKIISSLTLFIGYLAPLWTEKKQAFHDIISGCLVINGATNASQIKRVESAVTPNTLSNDEAFYLSATEEFSGPLRQAALWAKVLTLHDGDEERAKFAYIRERVAQMLAVNSNLVANKADLSVSRAPARIVHKDGRETSEFIGEKGETYMFTDAHAASAFASKHGVKLSPVKKNADEPAEKAADEMAHIPAPVDGLSLEERVARLDAALKAAAERKK